MGEGPVVPNQNMWPDSAINWGGWRAGMGLRCDGMDEM